MENFGPQIGKFESVNYILLLVKVSLLGSIFFAVEEE